MGAGPAVRVSSDQVRQFRIRSTGLTREGPGIPDRVLDLGVQELAGWGTLALTNRLPDGVEVPDPGAPDSGSPLALVWSLRGSPHLHRRADLPAIARGVWPTDPDDAKDRLVGSGADLVRAGVDPLWALSRVTRSVREVLASGRAMVKGELSAAVTAATEPACSAFCRGCGVVHVREMLLRTAALPAAAGLLPDTKPVVLQRLAPSFPIPTAGDPAALVQAYLRLYGGGAPGDIATHLGTSAARLRPVLNSLAAQGRATEISVDGRRVLAATEILDRADGFDLPDADPVVRLLGPGDPLLSPRDRSVLEPDLARQKLLWPTMGTPGALLADGRIAGIWRPRKAGRRLTVSITLWHRLSGRAGTDIAREAQRVAASRGADAAVVELQ